MGVGYIRQDTGNLIDNGQTTDAVVLDSELDAVEAAFHASTGHTHDGTAAEGGPITLMGPVQDFVVSATEIKPKTTNTLDIGTTSLRFKDAFLQGDITLGTIVFSDNTGTLEITGDADISGGLIANDVVDFSGATSVAVPNSTTAGHALNVTTGDGRYVVNSGFRLEKLHAETDTSGTEVDFTTNFSSTDREIIFDFQGISHNSTSTRALQMSFSTDGGSTFAMTGSNGYNAITAGTVTNAHTTSSSTITLTPLHDRTGGATTLGSIFGRVRILQNHADTTLITYLWDLYYVEGGGNTALTHVRGAGYVTTASGTEIDAVRFNWSSGASFQSWGVIRHLSVAN